MKTAGTEKEKSAGRAREYDGYAVGRRVLSLAPAWLLLIVVGFALALLFFSWMNRRSGAAGSEAFKNEATNQRPSPVAAERSGNAGAREQRATDGGAVASATESAQTAATPVATSQSVGVAVEGESYSVQVGAFADLSQANEQVSRLRAAGFEARVVEAGEATRFRFQVRSGRYATREEAARLASALHAGGVAGETVIIDPERK